jgi:hypothetical protein
VIPLFTCNKIIPAHAPFHNVQQFIEMVEDIVARKLASTAPTTLSRFVEKESGRLWIGSRRDSSQFIISFHEPTILAIFFLSGKEMTS